MSRLEPKNREEAFTYQFEDDVKVMRAASFNENEFEKALGTLETHIAAYRNKRLAKASKKAHEKYLKRIIL